MITVEEYLGQHAAEAAPGDLTDEIRANAAVTVERVNRLCERLGVEARLRSGWRPPAFNASFLHHDAAGNLVRGGAKQSRHATGEGEDVADARDELDVRITDELLEEFDLYREHPDATPGWCHLQICAPKSGRRTFHP